MQKLIFIFSLWIFTTFSFMAQNNDANQIIQSIQEKYAPDKRVVLFNIKTAVQEDGTVVLEGETSHREAYEELTRLSGVDKTNVRLLPDEVIGEKEWGVIYNSVEKLHSSNSYATETITEVLLGMPVKLLDKKGGWRRVQTPEGYIGWVSGAIQPMTEADLAVYNKKPKIVVTSLYALSYEKPDVDSQTISNLTVGNMLELKGERGDFFHIAYPDGREAFLKKSDAKEQNKWLENIVLSRESIVSASKKFMGIPYVWGGTSAQGLDCSGFSKLVYFLHGLILPRDASQQVFNGKLIDETGDFGQLQLGDLVFFGTKASDENPRERVVHVGIYIGNNRFIHASDYIQIGSFDPADELFDEFNTNRYLRTKRIIGQEGTKGIERIMENAFYK